MRVRITRPSGEVVEVEGTRQEVEGYMRGKALPAHAQTTNRRHYQQGDVLEGVVIEESPAPATPQLPAYAGRPAPLPLVDEYEVARYFRSGWGH